MGWRNQAVPSSRMVRWENRGLYLTTSSPWSNVHENRETPIDKHRLLPAITTTTKGSAEPFIGVSTYPMMIPVLALDNGDQLLVALFAEISRVEGIPGD